MPRTGICKPLRTTLIKRIEYHVFSVIMFIYSVVNTSNLISYINFRLKGV